MTSGLFRALAAALIAVAIGTSGHVWRWTKSKGLIVSFSGDPEPPAWVSQLYPKR